jgi:hypothetical protein
MAAFCSKSERIPTNGKGVRSFGIIGTMVRDSPLGAHHPNMNAMTHYVYWDFLIIT